MIMVQSILGGQMQTRELGRNRSHVYRSRNKTEGWYGRRFGKNPRWANPLCDDRGQHESDDNEVAGNINEEQVDYYGLLSSLHLDWYSYKL